MLLPNTTLPFLYHSCIAPNQSTYTIIHTTVPTPHTTPPPMSTIVRSTPRYIHPTRSYVTVPLA